MGEMLFGHSSQVFLEPTGDHTTFIMQSSIVLIFAAFVACTYAQVSMPSGYAEKYPRSKFSKIVRHPRDTTWERNVGRGKVFGTLGSTDDSLFGKGGYKQDIFDDHRGKLSGQAYGSRVLNDYGGSSVLGGKLDWKNANDNARASLDVYKEIGRGSGMQLTGEGVWKLDHNTRLVTGGNLQKNFGHDRPEFGIQGKIEHDF